MNPMVNPSDFHGPHPLPSILSPSPILGYGHTPSHLNLPIRWAASAVVTGALWGGGACDYGGRRRSLSSPAPMPGVEPTLDAASSPSERASADRRSRPAGPAPRSMCPGPHIPFVEQNFLINKQDLGFHIGEAMTEEGSGLSTLSAPGLPTPPHCLEGLRGERKEVWANSTFFSHQVTDWQLASAPLVSCDVPCSGHQDLCLAKLEHLSSVVRELDEVAAGTQEKSGLQEKASRSFYCRFSSCPK